MKENEKSKLQQLDPDGSHGTIQRILLDPQINVIPYHEALYWLVKEVLKEREYYQKNNQKLEIIMKANGLYTSEVLGLGESD